MASDKLIVLNDQNFKASIEGATPIVVDFWAEWCPPCKAVAPAFEALAGEMAGKVRFGKVNVDEASAVAAQYGVQSIPAFLVFKNGQVASKFVGGMNKDALRKRIEEAIK